MSTRYVEHSYTIFPFFTTQSHNCDGENKKRINKKKSRKSLTFQSKDQSFHESEKSSKKRI